MLYEQQIMHIHPNIERDVSEIKPPFKLSQINKLPIDLKPGTVAIISSWDSNFYVKVFEDNIFEIFDEYGAPISLDKEYILIIPRY